MSFFKKKNNYKKHVKQQVGEFQNSIGKLQNLKVICFMQVPTTDKNLFLYFIELFFVWAKFDS